MIKKNSKVGAEQVEQEKFNNLKELERFNEGNSGEHAIEEEREAPDKEDGEERIDTERGLLSVYEIGDDEAIKVMSKT